MNYYKVQVDKIIFAELIYCLIELKRKSANFLLKFVDFSVLC